MLKRALRTARGFGAMRRRRVMTGTTAFYQTWSDESIQVLDGLNVRSFWFQLSQPGAGERLCLGLQHL
jgi:hypothetical protein